MTTLETLFGKKENVLIGMIHLSPLLSFDGFSGMDLLIRSALKDLEALEQAGFDGVLIENNDDKPHTEFANEAQIASFTAVAQEVARVAKIKIGVQMMLNDWKASFAIGTAVGAEFTRLDVFVDDMHSEWGDIQPNPVEIMKYKESIAPHMLLFTDIQVKHKSMITPRPLIESAKLAIDHGSDALVVTGVSTGVETPLEKIKEVRQAFSEFPILVGAGVHEGNILEQLSVANGALVGTSIKSGANIDREKAAKLVSSLEAQ
jgi:hypothetical protein